MYNFNIEKQRKLVDLIDVIVPQTFRNEAPQFTEMIKSFLINIEQVQSSINQTFLDTIDPNKIKSNDIMKLYFDTYLKTLNISATENFLPAKDLLSISKELILKKGTPFIYNILINLLVYIFPNFGNQYQLYLAKLSDPTLTDDERKFYEDNVAFMEAEGLTVSNVNIIESSNVFEYSVEADIDDILFETYIKPFCHPAGWHVTFIRAYNTLIQDNIIISGSFMIFEVIVVPNVTADGTETADNPANVDLYYPNHYLPDRDIGDSSVYDSIIGMLDDTDRIYVSNGRTYCKEILWTTDETIKGDFNKPQYQSLVPSGWIPITAGGYNANGDITANYSMLASGGHEIVQSYYIDGVN